MTQTLILNIRESTYVWNGSKSYLQGISLISLIEPKIKGVIKLDYGIYQSISVEEKRNYIVLETNPKKVIFFNNTEFIKGFKDICSTLGINHNSYIHLIHINW